MEEDVEIEELLRRNEGMLIEAVNSTDHSLCSEGEESDRTDPSDSVATNPDELPENFNKSEKESEIDEVQELLDDNLISYRSKRVPFRRAHSDTSGSDVEIVSSEESDCNDGDAFINEIMSDNENQYKEQVRKHIGSKTKLQLKAQSLKELNDVERIIVERGSFLDDLEAKLHKERVENLERQKEIKDKLVALSLTEGSRGAEPSYTRCFFKKFGMPYFKDNHGFKPPAPLNGDHKLKLDRGELIVTSIPKLRSWVKSEKNLLCNAIRDTLIEEHSLKLRNEIKKLQTSSTFTNAKELEDQIVSCQEKLRYLKNKSYLALISQESPDRDYDWLKYSASIFEGNHSPEECKKFWHIYLRPSINKGSWEVNEDLKLLEIADEMHCQDWDAIATLLGTNRSAYQCFVHYHTRINTKRDMTHGKWTQEEDDKLTSIIDASRIGDFIPWTKVSSHFANRTHTQIYNRWANCLNPKLIKGRFSPQEDLLIVSGIEVFGVTYKELASLMSNRTSSQIRERYERHLLPKTVQTGTWSLQEDEKLVRLVKEHGEGNWVAIAYELKTRSRTQCRQRFGFIQRMKKKIPGWDINKIKRKKFNNISNVLGKTQKHVEKIKEEIQKVENTFKLSQLETETFRIEKLKQIRDTIMQKKCVLRRKKRVFSDNSEVNNLLLEYFKTSYTKQLTKIPKFKDNKECEAYMNEIVLLAKYFGHDLQLPECEDEVEDNSNLPDSLKYFLNKIITIKESKSKAASRYMPSCSVSDTNIDYVPPEIDDTIIMIDSWHSPPIDVSVLNFSEYFKRIVFDFSYGMHSDIWRSKMNRTSVPCLRSIDTEYYKPETSQPFYIPPNFQTALGYKTMLLGRNRLKKEANTGFGKKLYGCINEIQTKNEPLVIKNDEVEVDSMLLDQYQETMLSLFAWAKVLSVTNVESTRIAETTPKRGNAKQQQKRPKREIEIYDRPIKYSVMDSDNAKGLDPVKVDKVRKTALELKEKIKTQTAENKKGIKYQRKMQIEHLASDNQEEPKIKIARIYRKRNVKEVTLGKLDNKTSRNLAKKIKTESEDHCEVDDLPLIVRPESIPYRKSKKLVKSNKTCPEKKMKTKHSAT